LSFRFRRELADCLGAFRLRSARVIEAKQAQGGHGHGGGEQGDDDRPWPRT
jgi:hypothetical protein